MIVFYLLFVQYLIIAISFFVLLFYFIIANILRDNIIFTRNIAFFNFIMRDQNQTKIDIANIQRENNVLYNYAAEWVGSYPTQWQIEPTRNQTDSITNKTDSFESSRFGFDFYPDFFFNQMTCFYQFYW